METKVMVIPRWEDIVFDQRNRAYGAYLLRKRYAQRVLLGSGISIALFALLVMMLHGSGEIRNKVTPPSPKGEVTITPLPDIQRKEETTRKADKLKKPETQRPTTIRVVTHQVDTSVVFDLDADIVPDLPPEFFGEDGEGIPEGIEEGTGPIEPVVRKEVSFAEEMPVYEGGLDAMYKFIKKHTRYPKSAKSLRVEGTVYVSFVVDGDGNVRDVRVVRGIHRACDAEAVRVIGMLSEWRGGRQNGVPVDVRMVLPIKFQLD